MNDSGKVIKNSL
jgi:hypothetical protein